MTPSLFCLVLFCWPIADPNHLQSATAGATFCQVYQPVYWHKSDTRRTKESVDALNRVWKELCQKKKKP